MAGVDVILDHIGADYLQRNLDILNVDGRLLLISMMGGAVTEVNISCLLARRLTVQGIITTLNKFGQQFSLFGRIFISPSLGTLV